jgi:AcrR family transcriptional regulator
MGRWEPDARGRLERAALELFVERGFEQVTVTEIARRAGLAQRTFFRHFADKREVLFSGASTQQEYLVSAVARAPDAATPIDAVDAALEAAAAELQERGEYARQRQAVIAANPELQERELIKLASLAAAIADALRGRGVTDPAASLAAEAGIAVYKISFERWVSEPGPPDLPELIRESFGELREVTAGSALPRDGGVTGGGRVAGGGLTGLRRPGAGLIWLAWRRGTRSGQPWPGCSRSARAF